jgi:hypothetical protein
VAFRLRRIHDERGGEWEVRGEQQVTRGDPTAIHSAKEFIGMSVAHAEAWAGALGWSFRNLGDSGWITNDQRTSRINVWTDHHGIVVRAAIY